MARYEHKIDEALSYLTTPGLLNATGDHPICYLVYEVKDAMEINRMIDHTIKPKAVHAGFQPHVLSMANLVGDYITSHDYFDVWESLDSNFESDVYGSIRESITDENYLASALLNKMNELSMTSNPLLIIKDLEWLHPFDKMGRLEQLIYTSINIPVLVLYPGEAQGTARKFLNIHSMDGSYRSKNF